MSICHSVACRRGQKMIRVPLACMHSTMLLCMIFVAFTVLLLCLSNAEITEPSNCGPARGRLLASAFSSVGKSSFGRQRSATQIYDVDSVAVFLLYNGDETELPVYLEGGARYDLVIPHTAGVNVASAHLELRDKNNATLVYERTQSVAFWIPSQELNVADWRPTSDDVGLMVKLSQHLKGQGLLQDAMQASRCAFERVPTRTFQNVMARIEFICALAALSPSQHSHINEALDLATQLQVSHVSSCRPPVAL
jgi:hypothetical protein